MSSSCSRREWDILLGLDQRGSVGSWGSDAAALGSRDKGVANWMTK